MLKIIADYLLSITNNIELYCDITGYMSPSIITGEQKRPDIVDIKGKVGNIVRKKAKLETLYDRREKLCVKLFSSIEANDDHKLKELLPPKNLQPNNLRTNRKYNLPKMHTNRFSNSFIPYCARNATL